MKSRLVKIILFSFLLIFMLLFLVGDQGRFLTIEKIKNARYQSDGFDFRLKGGVHYLPNTAEGINSDPWNIQLVEEHTALGDLNGDRFQDTAVILKTWTGGTGEFYDLAVLINQQGSPQQVASISLGDRIEIRHLSIENNSILLEMIIHAPTDPLCCPSLPKMIRYILTDQDLIKVREEVLSP